MLKNAVVDKLINLFADQNKLPYLLVQYTYVNTSAQDKLRQLFVDMFTTHPAFPVAIFFKEGYKSKYPRGFLFDLCRAGLGMENAKKQYRSST
jgi:hypothetical protein